MHALVVYVRSDLPHLLDPWSKVDVAQEIAPGFGEELILAARLLAMKLTSRI